MPLVSEPTDVQRPLHITSPRFAPEGDRCLRIATSIVDFECGFRIGATGKEWTVQTMNVRPMLVSFKFLEGKEARVCYLFERGPSTQVVPTDSIKGRETVPHGSALMARLQFKRKAPLPHDNFHTERDDRCEDDKPGVKGIRKIDRSPVLGQTHPTLIMISLAPCN